MLNVHQRFSLGLLCLILRSLSYLEAWIIVLFVLHGEDSLASLGDKPSINSCIAVFFRHVAVFLILFLFLWFIMDDLLFCRSFFSFNFFFYLFLIFLEKFRLSTPAVNYGVAASCFSYYIFLLPFFFFKFVSAICRN